jgi:L-threonylcarbamoyladenylate synthase
MLSESSPLQILAGFSNIELARDMKTKIVKVSLDNIAIDKIEEIVEILRSDGVIVYPTETFYGLGANGFSAAAIRKVYRLKKREPLKPLSVVISDLSMLSQITSEIPSFFRQVVSKFWPGPLTLILKASPAVPDELLGQEGTIGVRLTGHKWVRSLVRQAHFPITATSANISGEMAISHPKKAKKLFEGLVDLIVDGGTTRGLLPSTVVDLSGKEPRLIREGAIPSAQLKKYLSSLSDSPS